MISPLFDAGFKSGQEAAQAQIARLRASNTELLGVAKKFCIPEDFDFPGDGPVSCGFSCLICKGHGPTETTIEHAPKCALANSEKGT